MPGPRPAEPPSAAIRFRPLLAALLAGASSVSAAPAETSGWRGNGSGVFADAAPPTTWSPTTNVVWSTPLPSTSNASPVVIAGRVFCCSDPDSLLCLDAGSGKLLWSKKNPVEDGATPEQLRPLLAARTDAPAAWRRLDAARKAVNDLTAQVRQHPDDHGLAAKKEAAAAECEKAEAELAPFKPYLTDIDGLVGPSYPTPVSDGRRVWAAFSTGVIACYDLDGNRQWIRYLETPTLHDGQSSSPVLVGGRLLIHFDRLHALDPESGETAWTVDARASHGTPLGFLSDGVPMALLSSGEIVRVGDGHVMLAEVARMWFPSAVTRDDVAYLCDGACRALRMRSRSADEIVAEPLWRSTPPPGPARSHASPVCCEGRICSVSDSGHFIAVDAATGKLAYETRWDEKGFTQPLSAAGRYLYVCNSRGTTHVLDPAHGFAEVARNQLEPFGSSPAFSGERMYIRGSKAMYCFAGH